MGEVEPFYEEIVAKAGEAVIVASQDGTILEWNASAERIFGWSAAQALGENIDMLIPDNQKDRHWTGYDKVLASGTTQFGDGTVLTVSAFRSDGSRVGIEMSFVPLHDGDKVAGVAAIIRPVRREKRDGGG